MKFIWDENKNRINRAKHGVTFDTAKLVFADPLHLSRQDRYEKGEERWQTLGKVGGVVVLLVAHTILDEVGEETIRMISARKATKEERRYYEKAY